MDLGRLGSKPDESAATRRSSRRDDLIFVFFSFWMTVGLCLDGWAHRNRPELETFFTPWHGVFYTGSIGSAIWLATMIIRRRANVDSFRAAIPAGYGLAVIGLVVFTVGGVGDGIWHTTFGVETGLDALLSPTHLIMLVGTLAGATAPLRAAWHDPNEATSTPSPAAFLAPLLSMTLTTVAVAFFFLYANGFFNWQMAVPFVVGEDSEVTASLGILATMASTLILLAPVMVLLRRWQPPFGSFTVLFGGVGLFMTGLDAFEYWWQAIAPIAGGLVADGAIAYTKRRRSPGRRMAPLLCGGLVPAVMWSISTIATHLAWGVEWPPELWLGNIVMAILAGLGLAMVAYPPPIPDRATA